MMKHFIVFVIAFCSGIAVFAQDGLSTSEFESRLGNKQVQVLDVRTAGEYRAAHLKNALQADWLNKDQFAERVSYLDKTKPVLVYCASGVRSGQAAKWMQEKGFTDVQNLKGGLTAWKIESRPVESAGAVAQMSMQQFQQAMEGTGMVLVDVGAEWCPPCRKMEPVLSQLRAELKDSFRLVKVDGGNDVEVMKSLNVDAIPTFIIYKQGKEVWRKQGVAELEELMKQLRG